MNEHRNCPQQVEGFAELVSPAFGEQFPGHWLGPDFRGPSEAGTTPEWWRTGDLKTRTWNG